MVINVGGSFKIYELLALLLLITCIPSLLTFKGIKFPHVVFVLLLTFFIISPVISLAFRSVVNPETNYYIKYPEAENLLRFNMLFSMLFIYLYYVLCWVVVKCIATNDIIVRNVDKYIRLYVYIGCVVAIYQFIHHCL